MRILSGVTAITAALLCGASTAAAPDVRSVYVKNSELWVRGSTASAGEKITSDGRPKFFPVWSPDGDKIAFVRTSGDGSLGEIVVVSPTGEPVREVVFRPVKAAVSGMRFIEGLKWIRDYRVMVFGSINPSTVEYAVVDVESAKQVEGHVADGYSLVPSPDGKHVAYEGYIPHFTPEDRRRPQLCVDHECDFDVPPWRGFPGSSRHFEFLSIPSWSRDSSEVAILAQDYDNKTQSLIVKRLGEKPKVYGLLSGTGSSFQISWGENALFVTVGDAAWRLDEASDALTPVSTESVKDVSREARQFRSRLEAEIEKLGGVAPDFWCASCPLAR